jgi:hypothetical protein
VSQIMRIHFDDNFLWVAHQELESFILFYRSLYSQTKNWSDTSGWFRGLKITSMVVNGQLRLVLGLIKFGGSLKKKPRVFTSFDRIGQVRVGDWDLAEDLVLAKRNLLESWGGAWVWSLLEIKVQRCWSSFIKIGEVS